jgi:hypothetical protein
MQLGFTRIMAESDEGINCFILLTDISSGKAIRPTKG